MKTYKVTVGEKEYIVKLEEVAEGTVVESAAADPVPTPSSSGTAEIMEAPLQGSILRIDVEPNQSVKTGETVLIIEAMKLENEIVAPRDGIVEQIFVKEGQTVNAEDALYSLK